MNESFPKTERPPHIGLLKTGIPVFDRPNSHIHNAESILEHLPQVFSEIDPQDREIFVESVDLGKTVGHSICVETTDQDEIVYAQRIGRSGRSRFVVNRDPEPTSQVTVILKKIQEGYLLITAFYGPKPEPEPWDRNATPESQQFWNTHALVWGHEKVNQRTSTKKID